ncbi:hypothetical protein HT031_006058 [Scenedesmus sp. PABB004]|nr:hypothetical protein HT031_006058 [Scenedesmus sp. PABB004]
MERSEWARQEVEQLWALLRSLPLPWLGAERGDGEPEKRHAQQQQQQRLSTAMQAAAVVDGVGVWRTRLLGTASVLQFGGLASAAVSALSPQGPGCCDFNGRERVANVLTSLPYAAIGIHGVRRRRTAAGKLWAASMLGVCGASMTFHVSSGKWRDLGRKLDYWCAAPAPRCAPCAALGPRPRPRRPRARARADPARRRRTIAASSGVLTRALYPRLPAPVTAASLALTPFRPFHVATANAVAMEAKFLARALQSPDLRGAQKLHSAACVAGMALFAVEDASVPHVPLVHATWHCLSALGTAYVNALLADAEEQFPQLTLDGGRAAARRAGAGAGGAAPPRLDVSPLDAAPAGAAQ